MSSPDLLGCSGRCSLHLCQVVLLAALQPGAHQGPRSFSTELLLRQLVPSLCCWMCLVRARCRTMSVCIRFLSVCVFRLSKGRVCFDMSGWKLRCVRSCFTCSSAAPSQQQLPPGEAGRGQWIQTPRSYRTLLVWMDLPAFVKYCKVYAFQYLPYAHICWKPASYSLSSAALNYSPNLQYMNCSPSAWSCTWTCCRCIPFYHLDN